jgi:hypothetical protein
VRHKLVPLDMGNILTGATSALIIAVAYSMSVAWWRSPGTNRSRWMEWVLEVPLFYTGGISTPFIVYAAWAILTSSYTGLVRMAVLGVTGQVLRSRPPAWLTAWVRRYYGGDAARFFVLPCGDHAPTPLSNHVPSYQVGPGHATALAKSGSMDERDTLQSLLPVDGLYLLVPHGPTMYTVGMTASYLSRVWGATAMTIAHEGTRLTPFLRHIMLLFSDLAGPDAASVQEVIQGSRSRRVPVILLPGAVSDVFRNSSKNQDPVVSLPSPTSRVLRWAAEGRRPVVPVLLLDECSRYWQPRVVQDAFRWLNRLCRVGIPIPPLGVDRGSPVRIVFGPAIRAPTADAIHKEMSTWMNHAAVVYPSVHILPSTPPTVR